MNFFTEVPMPDSARDLVNKWGKRYQKEKKYDLTEYLDRLKQRFAWDNDEYDIPEDDIPHTDILLIFLEFCLMITMTWNLFRNFMRKLPKKK